MPICPKCRGESDELGAKCPRDEFYYIHEDALEDAERDTWIGTLAADKYVIVALISEGGMGAVYRAIQLPVQREIAFKVLRAELQDSKQGKERFAREARAISRLSHPNIITMHDFGVDNHGHPFMAMEYAPGQSLAEWMVTPGLSLERICHVFRQILAAMSEAHEQGVIHRDLKPENLIVTRAGNDSDFVKLLDFGIARMVHDTASRGLTRDGEVFGTPHYMAPEQALGKRDIGPPADVYALGIMFFELLSGECPFDAPTPLSILYMQINDELPELRPKNRMNVPDGLFALIALATAKDPTQRFENAGAMLNAMDHAIGDMSGIFARPGDPSGLFARPDATGETSRPMTSPPVAKATEIDLPPVREEDAALISNRFPVSNEVPINDFAKETDLDLELPGFKRKYGLLALLFLLLIVGGGMVVSVVSGSGDADKAGAAEKDSDLTPTADEPVDDSAEAMPPTDEVKSVENEPVEADAQPDVLAGAAVDDIEKPAPKVEKAPAQKPDEKNAGVKPAKTPKVTPKKANRKPPKKSPAKSKPPPKKFQPVKFGAPPAKKDTTPRKFEPK